MTKIANFWRRVRCIAEACLKKEGMAFLALMISLFGVGIITFMLLGNLWFLRAKGAVNEIFLLSAGMLGLIFVVFMSTHRLLGSRQALEAEFLRLKLKFEQGGKDAD